jgi:hypothetical protein
MKLHKIFVLGGLALASLGGTFLHGQAGGGSVVGTVHDPSGAVVPKAEITLTNTDTGASLSTRTSSEGRFVFPLVQVDTYSVTVRAQGFETVEAQNIIVGLNKTVERFDARRFRHSGNWIRKCRHHGAGVLDHHQRRPGVGRRCHV